MIRNVVAVCLSGLAVLLVFISVTTHAVSQLGRNSEAGGEFVTTVARDPEVRWAIAMEIASQLLASQEEAEVSSSQLAPPVAELLASEPIDAEWRALLGRARMDFVASLDTWRHGDPHPGATLDIAPLATMVAEQLRASDDPAIAATMAQATIPESIVLPDTTLPAGLTGLAAPALTIAKLSGTLAFLAAVLLVIGLGFATSKARGGVVFLAGVCTVAGALVVNGAIKSIPSRLGSPHDGPSKALSVVAAREVTASLTTTGYLLLLGGVAGILIGIAWWVASARRGLVTAPYNQ